MGSCIHFVVEMRGIRSLKTCRSTCESYWRHAVGITQLKCGCFLDIAIRSIFKGKGKVCPRTSHEGPEGE